MVLTVAWLLEDTIVSRSDKIFRVWPKSVGPPQGQVAVESRELKAIEPWVIIRQCHPPAHERRFPMASNSNQIVQYVQQDFQALVAYVTGPEARVQTAYTVELTLFRRLLALGATLLRLFFVTRAAVRPSGMVTSSDGTRLTYHDQRPTTYYSVFGKVRFWRPYFTA